MYPLYLATLYIKLTQLNQQDRRFMDDWHSKLLYKGSAFVPYGSAYRQGDAAQKTAWKELIGESDRAEQVDSRPGCPSSLEAERLMDQVQDQITFVKVGLELYTAAGPDMVQRLIKRGMRVFLDLKFLDIEETVRRPPTGGRDGSKILTIHANRKALAAAVKGGANPR